MSQSTIKTLKVPVHFDGAIQGAEKFLDESKEIIVVNFADCLFITVDGLEWLEKFVTTAEDKNRSCRFENLKPSIYKVFKVARIDCLLRSCGSPGFPEGAVC